MRYVTYEEVIDQLSSAVDEKGEHHVYAGTGPGDGPTCRYAARDKSGELVPDCIVGHALYALGVPLEDMEYIAPEGGLHDEMGNEIIINPYSVNVASVVIRRLKDNQVLEFSPAATEALADAQRLQDDGSTWGEALRAAQEVLPD